MSLPPETAPDGDYSVPPFKPHSASLPTAFGIGCGFLFLLTLIGGIVVVRGLKSQITHPSKNSLLGTAMMAGNAGRDGAKIAQAVAAYRQQHGQYPRSLMDLVAAGTLDGKLLHNALDDNPNPGHVSWRYTPPAEGASGKTPTLEEPYHVNLGSGSRLERIVVTLNGRSAAISSPSLAP